MILYKKAADLSTWIQQQRAAGKTIGFIPTMGALHAGHTSLVSQSIVEGHYTVVSIFVNPTQFNNPEDLQKYPRTTAQDIALLETVGTQVLFLPEVSEIYPQNLDTEVDLDFGQMMEVLEGEFRPGHFKGMVQVVKRLLDLVQPDHLYMGQKDFQQWSIVNHMLQALSLPITLHMGTTIRETDGLAMSSRNVRLSPQGRAKAPVLYQSLLLVKTAWQNNLSLQEAIREGLNFLAKEPAVQVEYLRIVDQATLLPPHPQTQKGTVIVLIAAWIDGVRLIDNLLMSG